MNSSLENALRLCHLSADDHRVSAASDLTIEGLFGEEWLIVTNDRLLVTQMNNGSSAVRHDFFLKDIQGARLISHVGCGALTATVMGESVELIRYSNGKQKDFASIAKYLEQLHQNNGSTPKPAPKAVEPASKPPRASQRPALLRLFAYLKPYRFQVVLLSLMVLGGTVLGLVTPYLTRPLVDVVLMPGKNSLSFRERGIYLALIGAGMLVCQLLHLGLNIVQGRTASRLTHQLANILRIDVFQHLQFLSIRFFDKKEVGSLVSRITQDTSELESALAVSAQFLLANLLTIVGIGIVLCIMNWKLFVVAILPLPAAYFLSQLMFKRMSTMWNRWWHQRGRLHALLTETLIGVRVVKAFAQEQREISRFKQRSNDLASAGQEAEQTWMTVYPVLTLITGLGALLVWVFGGLKVLTGAMTLGTLMTFVAYLAMFYGPFQFVNRITEWLGRTKTAAERIFDILDNVPETKEARAAVSLPRMQGAVQFRHVNFGYDPHVIVLKDLHLEVEPGEMIGLVGHSGAGKSTMINLLCRFYDVNDGELLIDGIDIRSIRHKDLRSQIGIVSQDTFLFNTTIARNIGYAKPGATPLEIMAAAKAANAHGFIVRKPDGYDTLVGERGMALSAGERQRIAIARAILHNPRILVLDEATSSVDADTESQIQEALAHLVEGRTTFAIAHRLSTLRNADRLIVLNHGRIVEMGTHDELRESNGEFSRLVRLQQDLSNQALVAA